MKTKWVGSRLAACMWIHTEAVLCDGPGPTLENLRRKLSTITEGVRWVCEEALRDHEWVTELNVTLKENEILMALNCDFDVPCLIQWVGTVVVLVAFATKSKIREQ